MFQFQNIILKKLSAWKMDLLGSSSCDYSCGLNGKQQSITLTVGEWQYAEGCPHNANINTDNNDKLIRIENWIQKVKSDP